MANDMYRHELRNHFMDQVKNTVLQNASETYREHSTRAQQKMNDLESVINSQRRLVQPSQTQIHRHEYQANQHQHQHQTDQHQQHHQHQANQHQYQRPHQHQYQQQAPRDLAPPLHDRSVSPMPQKGHRQSLITKFRQSMQQTVLRNAQLQQQALSKQKQTTNHQQQSFETPKSPPDSPKSIKTEASVHLQSPQKPQSKSKIQMAVQAGDESERNNGVSNFPSQYGDESCRNNSDVYCIRNSPAKVMEKGTQLPPISKLPMKFQEDAMNFMYDTDSNPDNTRISIGTAVSVKSSKTVVSKKSSQELRKIVKSQCKLHEVIDETLKKISSNENTDTKPEPEKIKPKEPTIINLPQLPNMQCDRCSGKLLTRASREASCADVQAKADFPTIQAGQPADTLTISVDEVVNSKVINPMIRKLQRMYLNNLREEMSLMEDLERLPHKVNEVYRAAIYKKE